MPGHKKSGIRQPLAIRLIFSAAPVAGTRLAWSPVGSRYYGTYQPPGHRAAAAVAGPGRVPDGDPLAGEVAQLCGHLPLALRIAAALLRHRPAGAWSIWPGCCASSTGACPRALALYQQALTMNRDLNKPDDEAIAHEGLGECHLSTAQPSPAPPTCVRR